MGDAWFTGCADELARCLVDARACAEACEAYLGRATGDEQQRAVGILAPSAAVSRVLIELIDQPPQLILAAVRLCYDLSSAAADELGAPDEVVAALSGVAASARALLESTG